MGRGLSIASLAHQFAGDFQFATSRFPGTSIVAQATGSSLPCDGSTAATVSVIRPSFPLHAEGRQATYTVTAKVPVDIPGTSVRMHARRQVVNTVEKSVAFADWIELQGEQVTSDCEEFWIGAGSVACHDTDDEHSRGIARHWQETLSATHLPWLTTIGSRDGRTPRFEASVRRRWIDDLALVDCDCGPCSGTRRRRQLADTEGEFLVVLVTLSGHETVVQDDLAVELSPGDAVVWDSTQPARFAVPGALSKRSLIVPRAALNEIGGRRSPPRTAVLCGDAPMTQLLVGYLESVQQVLPRLGTSAVTAVRNAILELLIGALHGDGEPATLSTSSATLHDAMDRFIGRNLLDERLSSSAVAAAHGVSVRTVNRIFSVTGQTVAEIIRTRRLARARTELLDTDQPIGSIASKFGFADTSHFGRSFRAVYGVSPREYRQSRAARRSHPVA